VKHTPRNLVYHELIGLEAEVVSAKNPSLLGHKGIVVDETKNLLVLNTKKGVKKILKEQATFRFTLPNGTRVVVEGSVIVGSPEDRLKKKFTKRW